MLYGSWVALEGLVLPLGLEAERAFRVVLL